ncbi:reverse transcriptase-rnase h-integrase [Moniliophthora roreri MCA 2997]|uniref:Reverse transcriptase-rnase h-integrase n=2 Tax=Moniliophthora roreri TaxID=221103 RepID=V2XVL8_MONRO|nr:reverse transcriptase-rnase h-integrase [Moniliophthora roreri MCA 2997]
MEFEPNQPPSEAESVNQYKQQQKQAGLEEAKAALDKAKQEYTQYYNSPAPEFKLGDKVWLDAYNIQTDQLFKKLADCNLVFPVIKLTTYTPDSISGHAPKPPPTPVVIEMIIDAKYRWWSLWYWV